MTRSAAHCMSYLLHNAMNVGILLYLYNANIVWLTALSDEI